MKIYEFTITKEFERSYKKYIKGDVGLKKIIDQKIIILTENPFSSSLKTHKVNTRNYGIRYSSRVTGDLRIIWDFFDNRTTIIALTIGGHSGNKKVYN
jgi:mRNA-degrading endonuclease YafQ of YafQ-DinJ toxin-antitoxin module